MSEAGFSKRGWKILLAILGVALVAAIMYIAMSMGSNPGQDGLENFYVLLSSSVIALIGVSVTGYIFLTESLRSTRDSNPRFLESANSYQKTVFSNLLRNFAIGIIIVVLFAIFAYYTVLKPDFIYLDRFRDVLMVLSTALFAGFLCWSIYLDINMMNIESGINAQARKILDSRKDVFSKRCLLVRMNTEEYRDLIEKDDDGVYHDFTPGHSPDPSITGMILAINGKRYQDLPEVVDLEELHYIAYRDISDELQVNRVITMFDDIEAILCRMVDNGSETLDDTDKKRLESLFGIGSGRMSEVGMANDIIDYYFELKKYRDSVFVVSGEDRRDDFGVQEEKESEEDGIPDWITYEGTADCRTVRDTPRTRSSPVDKGRKKKHLFGKEPVPINISEHLLTMTPFVYLLRYELAKKLRSEDLSNMRLSRCDLSYANLKKSSFRNSTLTDASFLYSDMTGADFTNCDLSGADFKNCTAVSAVFADSKIKGSYFDGSNCLGASFIRAAVSDSRFPGISMAGVTISSASVVEVVFENCNFTESSFAKSTVFRSVMDRCLYTNSKFSGATMSNCSIIADNFTSSDFTGTTVNNSTVKNSLFITSKMDGVVFISNTFLECTFSGSQMSGANFTGSQILAAAFDSTILTGSNFTRALIGAYRLDSSLNSWVIKDEDGLAGHQKIIEKIMPLGEDSKSGIADEDLDHVDITRMRSLLSKFDHSSMADCYFLEAEISSASMRYVFLNGSMFNKVRVSNTTFEKASLASLHVADTSFDRCNLNSTSFLGTTMTSSQFTGCFIEKSTFQGALITDVKFTDCKFKESSFDGAKIVDSWFIDVKKIDPYAFRGAKVNNLHLKDCTDADDNPIPEISFISIDQLKAYFGIEDAAS
ncbi:MAG: pentapeptide repeat-containing protein [Thermoplasmata archaeon]|nr:pentapeptide repeat-containing protein [Thermoplasmata archaeon]